MAHVITEARWLSGIADLFVVLPGRKAQSDPVIDQDRHRQTNATAIASRRAVVSVYPLARYSMSCLSPQGFHERGEAARNDVGRECRSIRIDEFQFVFFGEP